MYHRRRIVIGCILFNLLLGNIFLFNLIRLRVETVIIGVLFSLVCVLCYLALFHWASRPRSTGRVVLLSFLTCFVIAGTGSFLHAFVTYLWSWDSTYSWEGGFEDDMMQITFLSAIMGISGLIISLPISIFMGLFNIFWLRRYQKAVAEESPAVEQAL